MENIGIHKNIISIIGSVCDGNKPLLIVEFCPQGDLHAYLRKVRDIFEKKIYKQNKLKAILFQNYDQISKNLDDLGDKSSKLFFQDFGKFKFSNVGRHKLFS